ncbi:MAG: hypothetical protein ACKN9V_06625 [Pseudomonadota bacterium]
MAFFDYVHLPVGDWAAQLQSLNRSSSSGVVVRVFWGDHETLQGVRDFHSKTRLKLERVCSLAHSLQIPLRIQFGFFDEIRSFPSWTQQLLPQALVPKNQEDDLVNEWNFIRIPTFRNDEVRQGFVGFLTEALMLLSLHCEPEGSLKSVSFDWGVMSSDSSPMDAEFVESEFAHRYGSIGHLNSLFQTSFNNFQSVSKAAGFKTLLNKRPWIACWQYKSLKNKSLKIWESEIKAVFEGAKFSWSSASKHDCSLTETNSIVVDDTFLNLHGNHHGFNPLIIQTQIDANALRAYRLAEMLQIEAAACGEYLSWLSSWKPSEKSKACVVVCSKFIPRTAHSTLSAFMASGGKVFFPFGLPIWDENMDSLQWKQTGLGPRCLDSTEKLYDKLKEYFA